MYNVVFSKSAKKDLEKVESVYLITIATHIKNLSENPRPFGCTKLVGFNTLYRLRVGVYRIIYTIEDKILKVEVIKIDRRNKVYR